MHNIIYPLLTIFLLFGCSSPKKKAVPTDSRSNIIDLTAGFENIQPVKLSEIADSVSFIPFETTPQSLQGQGQGSLISFTPEYIFYYTKAFDWNGKYHGTIIRKGRGPLEEPEGGGTLLYSNNHFYSKGSKFIEYDHNGKPTSKVRSLYAESREIRAGDILRYGMGFSLAEENFVAYDFPTTLYYFNKDFETVSSRQVFQADSLPPRFSPLGDYNYLTYYNEKTVFYNFINDTIFYVTNTGLEPQWIVNFDDKLRLPAQAVYNYTDILMKILRNLPGRSEAEDLIDHKHKVIAAYETDKYIFFQMMEIFLASKYRETSPPIPNYVIYYEKETGETIRVKGHGFEDDLLGMYDYFYPRLGVYDEKLISFFWPHQLFDYIDRQREGGNEINPKILALSKQVKRDDNPVLILFHLKK